MTGCSEQPLLFQDLGPRQVVAEFSDQALSDNTGSWLLRTIDHGLGVCRKLAACFTDARDERFVEHPLQQLLTQRIYGLALGHEDLNDHHGLRADPLLAGACGRVDLLGLERRDQADRGKPLASAPTLNRLENSNVKHSRKHKLRHDPEAVEDTLLALGVSCLPKDGDRLVLDLDAMGHLVHGQQEGRHFNAYYDDYCYLPLYVVCGDVVLWSQLRTADHGAAHQVVPALTKILAALRRRFPKTKILVRGDSGFCNEEIMSWCEAQEDVDYVLGLGKNRVLLQKLGPALADARARHILCGGATVRAWGDFDYRTQRSWTRSRRVIGKAEIMSAGENPRFVVTSLGAEEEMGSAQEIYEQQYCPRGEMENVLKQQTLDLHADRPSTASLAGNQLRLWLSSFAYLLVERLRTLGCAGTELARARVSTIRVRLLKVTAQIKVSVRRVLIQISSTYQWPQLLARCQRQLAEALACG